MLKIKHWTSYRAVLLHFQRLEMADRDPLYEVFSWYKGPFRYHPGDSPIY